MRYLLFIILLFPAYLFAGVTGTYNGPLQGVRIEGNVFLLTLSSPLPGQTCTRVWFDVDSNRGKLIYSTALMAFSTKNENVHLRGLDDETQKVFGACKIYDILVNHE